MHIQLRGRPLRRLMGMLALIAILFGGATYAALQSQSAVLQGSTIASATAGLMIGNEQVGFGTNMPGFSFTNIEPGATAQPGGGETLSLKNTGTTDLHLRLSAPRISFNNPAQVDTEKVFVVLTPVAGGTPSRLSLAALHSAWQTTKPIALQMDLPAGQTAQYRLQMELGGDIVSSTSSGFTLRGIDLSFSGVTS